MTYAIETHDLTKAYDKATVVDNLNLQVKDNEVFGLLGPNGAGKTTTILMLLGLTEPLSGEILVHGFNPSRERLRAKRIIGYLPENVGFYESISARENLGFIAELNGLGEKEAGELGDELLVRVGLGNVKDTAVGKYSRGMKQRLGIAEVLLKKPKIAIFDEPTSGLDPKGINQLLDIISELPKQGTTVVLSSHQLHQVQRVCHSIGILAKGKMVIQGSMAELTRDALADGSYIIDVRTENPGAELADAIKKIDGVIRVEVQGDSLQITTTRDLRADISKTVVNNDYPLTEVKIQEFSLNDIYMKYFQEG
ncbi:ABC transporter ATP-binding protein [Chloroflexota bacterium]